jgi:hypothetical protein
MNEKRTVSDRMNLSNLIKWDLKVNFSVLFAIVAAFYLLYQSWDKMSTAQASQAQEISYQNKAISNLNESYRLLREAVLLNKETVGEFRIEYLTLIAAIRSENKDRYIAIIEKQNQLLHEIKGGRN